MDRKNQLLNRLESIGRSLEKTDQALMLLGLGSVGAELDRLDDFSDLDFFVIAKDGYKERFIRNVDWLEAVCPIVYTFQNTADGHKSLFKDGIFCEWAVFETAELASIPYTAGRISGKRKRLMQLSLCQWRIRYLRYHIRLNGCWVKR